MKLLTLSGFVPEQICDIVRFTRYSGTQKIAHYCGYVSDYIAQVIEDNSVDGAVFPRSCDSSRVINSYLEKCDKFAYQLIVPARKDEVATQILAKNIEELKVSLENYFDIEINDVEQRIKKINKRNAQLRELYKHIDKVSYSLYLEEIHNMLERPLDEQTVPVLEQLEGRIGKKVYVVGSFLSNINVVKLIENAGLIIAGDNITESKRLFSAPDVECSGDFYMNIAKSMLQNKLSPTQNDFESILMSDLDEIMQKEIQGVVYITQKYCEPYDYMYSVYKKMLDENNIPVLRISLTDSTDSKVSEAAIEAFADIL